MERQEKTPFDELLSLFYCERELSEKLRKINNKHIHEIDKLKGEIIDLKNEIKLLKNQ